MQTAHPHVQSGKLRTLAVMSAERSPAYPDVPTMKEQGLPDLEVETWYGAVRAGRHAGAAIVQKLNSDVNALLPRTADARGAREAGHDAGGRHAAAAGASCVKNELPRWTRVVQRGWNQGGLMEELEDLVAAYRILAEHGVIDAYGHVSLRSPRNPQRYYLARSLAPELVRPSDIIEYDLDSRPLDASGPRIGARALHPRRDLQARGPR